MPDTPRGSPRSRDLLMLNLGSFFVTHKGGFCPRRIAHYATLFDAVHVVCLGDTTHSEGNVTYYARPFSTWPSTISQIGRQARIAYIKIQDLAAGGLLGLAFGSAWKVPVVLRCGSEWRYPLDSPTHALKAAFTAVSRRLIVRRVARIVFNSRFLQRRLASRPSRVVYNGVDVERFHPANRAFSKRLLFVGRVRADKGLLHLADALASTDWHLTIVGDGPLRERLATRPRVTCVGRMNHDRIPAIMADHDALILPSLPESSESFPNAILEAMASGLAVIATDIAGIPEMIADKENGILIPPRSATAIAQALAELDTPDTVRRLGENARHTVLDRFNQLPQLRQLGQALFNA